MSDRKVNIPVALAFVGLMFFSLGFALGINSFLIPVLKGALEVSSSTSYLLIAATFVPFLIFGYPASMLISKIGYKGTMAVSYMLFALAFGGYILSAHENSLGLFLLASFISGTANTVLQAAVNPYITILGPIESAARRTSIMGICNKLAWPVAPLFLAFVINKAVGDTQLADLDKPFWIIIAVFVILGIISLLAPLPEVKAVGEDEAEARDCPYAASKNSVWQFPHLILGCLALFVYVGAETVSLSTLVDYANDCGLPNADSYAWIPSVGMVIGYICGIVFIPKYLKQSTALVICSRIAILGSILVPCVPAGISIWCIGLLALGCSLMWPAVWPLAMTDLGRFTKAGGGLLTAAMAGGAVVPYLFGLLKDSVGMQNAYWICLPCFLIILLFGTRWYKIRK